MKPDQHYESKSAVPLLVFQCKSLKLPACETEFQFHPQRKWRVDVAFQPAKLAVEVEGGVYLPKARHTAGPGFEADCCKYAELAILGWALIRVTPRQVKNGQAVGWIERWFQGRKSEA